MSRLPGWAGAVLSVTVLALGAASTTAGSTPGERTVEVVARRYAFEPAVLRVERGDHARGSWSRSRPPEVSCSGIHTDASW